MFIDFTYVRYLVYGIVAAVFLLFFDCVGLAALALFCSIVFTVCYREARRSGRDNSTR